MLNRRLHAWKLPIFNGDVKSWIASEGMVRFCTAYAPRQDGEGSCRAARDREVSRKSHNS